MIKKIKNESSHLPVIEMTGMSASINQKEARTAYALCTGRLRA